MNDSTVPAEEDKKCLNCDKSLVGPFCHHCGQNNRFKRLDIRQLLGNFFQNIFNLDAAYPKTFIGLIRHPGIVCKRYVAGMRKRYANPFGYLVVAFALHVFLNALITKQEVPPLGGVLTLYATQLMGGVVEGAIEPEAEEERSDSDKPLIDQNSITTFTNKYNKWLTYALIIPLALIWAILFRKSQYNLAENYVFALYVFGQFTLLGLVLLFIPLPTFPFSTQIFGLGIFSLFITYIVYAGQAFYKQNSLIVLVKILASLVILTIFELLVAVLGMFIWLRLT